MTDVFDWIETALDPCPCTSDVFIYDDMDSQSGRSLPIIHQPFDGTRRSHWRDRGSALDYLLTTDGSGKRLLDFGPGDGWPSLIVAPQAKAVVSVDGSARRVAVCAENARHLGIKNARFLHVPPGTSLPFEDSSFDGAMAASSVEQSPDPKATLGELCRVLCPGGRLRIDYESLGAYLGGRERELWLWPIDDKTCRLILFDRDIERERVRQYGLTFSMPVKELTQHLVGKGRSLTFDALTAADLAEQRSTIVDARVCTTIHPSGRTLVSWLREVGFRQVHSTHSGADFAGRLFRQLPTERRPADVEAIDALLHPLIAIVVEMGAPISDDPMITAIK